MMYDDSVRSGIYPSAQQIQSVLRYEAGNLYWLEPPKRHSQLRGKLAGCRESAGYWVISLAGRRYYAHRLVWILHNGEIPGDVEIDHRNRVKSDNRIENLRLVTKSGNGQNRGARRIYWHRNRWIYQRVIDGRKIRKSFKTEAEVLRFAIDHIA